MEIQKLVISKPFLINWSKCATVNVADSKNDAHFQLTNFHATNKKTPILNECRSLLRSISLCDQAFSVIDYKSSMFGSNFTHHTVQAWWMTYLKKFRLMVPIILTEVLRAEFSLTYPCIPWQRELLIKNDRIVLHQTFTEWSVSNILIHIKISVKISPKLILRLYIDKLPRTSADKCVNCNDIILDFSVGPLNAKGWMGWLIKAIKFDRKWTDPVLA